MRQTCENDYFLSTDTFSTYGNLHVQKGDISRDMGPWVEAYFMNQGVCHGCATTVDHRNSGDVLDEARQIAT